MRGYQRLPGPIGTHPGISLVADNVDDCFIVVPASFPLLSQKVSFWLWMLEANNPPRVHFRCQFHRSSVYSVTRQIVPFGHQPPFLLAVMAFSVPTHYGGQRTVRAGLRSLNSLVYYLVELVWSHDRLSNSVSPYDTEIPVAFSSIVGTIIAGNAPKITDGSSRTSD